MLRHLILCVVLLAGLDLPAPAASAAAAPTNSPPAGAAIFDRPTLVRCRVQLAENSLNSLRSSPREYASGTITLDGQTFTNVGIHLKGAAGSFRQVDDRPALTVSFNKFESGGRWKGLRKIHLNNSVQDPSYMNEYLASELFRSASVPTPRVAFATVELNGRKLGLYVLKEGFTQDFLSTFFPRTDGNLYDGEFIRDVDQPLKRDEGKGPLNRADLKALAQAAREPDGTRRWEKLQRCLDVDRFITMAALDIMLVDWDGYPLNRNNYRIYFMPPENRAVFIPHGMDQLFQRDGMQISPGWNGLVASALLNTPEGRRRYQERFQSLFFSHFSMQRMTNTLSRLTDLLRPVQPDIEARASKLYGQIAARMDYLERQPLIESAPGVVKPPVRATPWPPSSRAGEAPATGPARRLTVWQPMPGGRARLDQTETDGRKVLQITATNACTAAWRSTLRLEPGRYRLQARAFGTGIIPLQDRQGDGAGMCVEGARPTRRNRVVGDTKWVSLAYEFEVLGAEREVVVLCELRARAGSVQFDLNSLQLIPQAP